MAPRNRRQCERPRAWATRTGSKLGRRGRSTRQDWSATRIVPKVLRTAIRALHWPPVLRRRIGGGTTSGVPSPATKFEDPSPRAAAGATAAIQRKSEGGTSGRQGRQAARQRSTTPLGTPTPHLPTPTSADPRGSAGVPAHRHISRARHETSPSSAARERTPKLDAVKLSFSAAETGHETRCCYTILKRATKLAAPRNSRATKLARIAT